MENAIARGYYYKCNFPFQSKPTNMNQVGETRQRIQSIDILRGLVMVIMALDHVRDFFYKADLGKAADAAMNPTDMATTFPALFFTRWITHFCAPIFVFLAGASIYLMCQRKSKKEISIFLLKRGFWLVFVELIIITFGWTFSPFFNFFIMQVIWAIGISMILMGFLVLLPYNLIFTIGLVIVAGHNLTDITSIGSGLKGTTIGNLLYYSEFSTFNIGSSTFLIVYAFLPWTGIMLLGYCFGKLYQHGVDAAWRRKMLIRIGGGLVLLFVLLRFSNLYGDPSPWAEQPRGSVYTFLSFLNLTKYPPSLLFICMTIGPGILFLAFIEKVQNGFTRVMNVYGRVPMLYYILHFFIIHLLLVIEFYRTGHSSNEIIPQNGPPFFFKTPDIGFGLWGVYAVWIFVVAVLYPVCKKYDRYKTAHASEKWWLSYL